MRKRKGIIVALAMGIIVPLNVMADDYVDDIYFNPKKDKAAGAVKKNPNYIENFSDMDVDAYNKRGQYYTSPVDTIGTGVGSEEDFVYTQQIQKYYNPTIVLDNEELLADVLDNSYGNVEIVYNGLTPAFLPVYGYGWPYYRSYYNPWAWNISFGWYDPWYIGPSWSWGWGPSWSWGPSWGWGPGWGPSWGWGPGWGPSHGPGWGRPNATWSPNGNRPVRPGVGWAGNTRPGAGVAARPGGNNASSGSKWSIGGNQRGSNYGQAAGAGGNRQQAAGSGNNRTGYTIGSDGHRYRGTGTVGAGTTNNNGSVGTNRTGGNQRSGGTYNSTTQHRSNATTTNRTTTTNRSTTTNRGSYNSNRSTGNSSFGSGSFGGGSSRSYGGGGGGSRSTGRGTRR